MKRPARNLKALQNLPNTPIGRMLACATWFGGRSLLLPRFVELVLTYRCNLNCGFCYQAPDKRESFPDMSLADARVIEKNIRKSYTFKPRVHFFGGEPTIAPDFLGILDHFSRHGYRCSVTTNGVNLSDIAPGLVAAKGLREMNVSLNPPDYRPTLSGLRCFREHDADKRVYLNCACPVTPANQSDLVEVVYQVEQAPADCLTFQHTTFAEHYSRQVDGRAVQQQVEAIKNGAWRLPVLFLPDIRPGDIPAYYGDPAFPYRRNACIFPWYVLFIQPNGDVIPCDEMDVPVGNVKDQSLKQVWNSDRFRAFRRRLKSHGPTRPICRRCCHRLYY